MEEEVPQVARVVQHVVRPFRVLERGRPLLFASLSKIKQRCIKAAAATKALGTAVAGKHRGWGGVGLRSKGSFAKEGPKSFSCVKFHGFPPEKRFVRPGGGGWMRGLCTSATVPISTCRMQSTAYGRDEQADCRATTARQPQATATREAARGSAPNCTKKFRGEHCMRHVETGTVALVRAKAPHPTPPPPRPDKPAPKLKKRSRPLTTPPPPCTTCSLGNPPFSPPPPHAKPRQREPLAAQPVRPRTRAATRQAGERRGRVLPPTPPAPSPGQCAAPAPGLN